MTESIFYFSLFMILYTYLGYPFVLFFTSLFVKNKVKQKEIFPRVTVVIPVYNGEGLIRKKIENCLQYVYPREKLNIIVVSDCSTDRTVEIVEGFRDARIKVLSLSSRQGKVAAQNLAVQQIDTEIIVFTDVAIMTDSNCIQLIVQNFSDPTIGAVSCRDCVVIEGNQSEGERSYIKYDMLVRKYSSRIGSIIGVTGGFYALRSEIATGGWDPAMPPDFLVALQSIKQGFRVVEDPRVLAYYKVVAREWDELPRKIRTINRGIYALYQHRSLLNFFKYGLVSFQLFHHKLLRWFTPFFLMALFLSNILVLDQSLFTLALFGMQLVVLLLAVFSSIGGKWLTGKFVFKLPRFFCLTNIAIVRAWIEFLTGKTYVLWEPTKR